MSSYAEIVKKGKQERDVKEKNEKEKLNIEELERELELQRIKKDLLKTEIEAQQDKESLARFKKVARDHFFRLDHDDIGRLYMSNSQFVLFYTDWRKLGESTWKFV